MINLDDLPLNEPVLALATLADETNTIPGEHLVVCARFSDGVFCTPFTGRMKVTAISAWRLVQSLDFASASASDFPGTTAEPDPPSDPQAVDRPR